VADLLRVCADRRLVAVEMSSGQFRDDVQLHLAKAGHVPRIELVNHMGGVVVTVDDIVRAVSAKGTRT